MAKRLGGTTATNKKERKRSTRGRRRRRRRRLRSDKFHGTPENRCFSKAAWRSSPLRIFRYYANARISAAKRSSATLSLRSFRFEYFESYVRPIVVTSRVDGVCLLRDSRPRRFQSDFDFESASFMSTVRFLEHVPVAWTPSERRSHVLRSSFVRRSAPLKIFKSSRIVLESTDGVLSEPLTNGEGTRAPVG